MAFDFLAAAAGFAEGASDVIEKRNKEIQRNALEEVEIARRAADEQNTKLRTKRDDMRATAEVLSSYGKFTETQVAGLLQKPAVAKVVVDKLKSAKRLDDIDFNKLYEISEGNSDATIESTIARMTSIPKEPATVSQATQAEPRGAFGLPSPMYKRTIAEGEKAAGMSLSEMRATARGVPTLTEDEQIKGKLNLGQFDDPESITNIQGKLRDNMAKGTKLTDPANEKLLKQLQANAVIKDLFDKPEGEGGGKPRSASAISSIFSKSLAVAVDPFVVKGVVRIVPETGDYVPVGGSVEDVAAFQKQKTETIKAQAKAIGILDDTGKIIGGRNSMDALVPYANIEGDKIVSWKADVMPKKDTTPAAPEKPAVVDTPITIPKTVDGKSIDATKLVAGQKYKAADGTTKTWNGTSWQ